MPCSRKMVLLALADHSDMDRLCWPSQNFLARRCGLTRQTVNRMLTELERDGWISIIPRKHATGGDRSSLYRLNMPISEPESKAVIIAPPPGFVYVATDGHLMKVGISRNVDQRMKTLTKSSGRDVRAIETFSMDMATARKVEVAAHEGLAQVHTHGEWFACSQFVATEAVKSAIAEIVPEVANEGGVTVFDTGVSPYATPGVTVDDTLNLHITKELESREKPLSPPNGDAVSPEERAEIGRQMRELARELGARKR